MALSLVTEISQAALGDPLTEKIVALRAAGLKHREIAERLTVSMKTVELRLQRFISRAAENRRNVA